MVIAGISRYQRPLELGKCLGHVGSSDAIGECFAEQLRIFGASKQPCFQQPEIHAHLVGMGEWPECLRFEVLRASVPEQAVGCPCKVEQCRCMPFQRSAGYAMRGYGHAVRKCKLLPVAGSTGYLAVSRQ